MQVPTKWPLNTFVLLTKRSLHLRFLSAITLVFLLALMLGSCATQKSKEKPSAFNRFYHNTTAYYNGYFNANVIYETSQAQLSQSYRDNYVQVLDVYDYVNVKSPEAVAAEIDRAIEKLSVVVALHRQSAWTDDSYMLVGKSQYLKQDYESAEETMDYFKETFSPEAVKNRQQNLSRKSRSKAKAKERELKKKEAQKERELRQKELKEKQKEKKEEIEQTRKERQKEAKRKAKERKKEAKRKQKERRKEAKARAKARKKGKKLPPRKTKIETQTDTLSQVEADLPEEETTPLEEPTEPELITLESPDDDETDEDSPPEEEEPKKPNYFLKHRPCYAEGMMWLGRIYTERQMYNEAIRAFTVAMEEPSASPAVFRETPVAMAHLFIKQKKYDEAIPYLLTAIQNAKKRKLKARYHYILAQIYQENGNLASATASYKKVRKLRPGYEMDFNARLNIILTQWQGGSQTADQAIKGLDKMLADKKNLEYKDRIHFTLADINLTRLDTVAAIFHLNEALTVSSGNTAQILEAQLKLANLHFYREEYVAAKLFYDKALENLPVSDERYDMVFRLSRSLTDIAKNITIMTVQDSLIRIAGMSEKEQIAWAEAIKAAKVAALEKEQIRKQTREANAGAQSVGLNAGIPARNAPGAPQPSTFFAYDKKVLERGLKDFEKYWGDRPLQDNWRQSSKINEMALSEQVESEDAGFETTLTKSELENLLKDVPSDDEKLAAANQAVQDAMLALGRLYREQLEFHHKSVEILDSLLLRYPETKHELDAWYFLHLAHKALGNNTEAKRYYDLILGKYPETTYARVLRDPNYLGEEKEKERMLNAYYQRSYELFQAGNYQQVWDRFEDVDTLFGTENVLQTKFALLKAMTVGSLQGKDAYIDALKDLIAKFPNTEEEKRAKEILRLLGDKSIAPKELTGQEATDDGQFNTDPEGLHYVIINWDINEVKVEDAQLGVNNFNNAYFKADRLRLSSNIFLDVDVPLMVVRKFDNAQKAMDYYNLSQKYASEFLGKSGKPFKIYPVTQQNYRVILKNRSLEAYDPFFHQTYEAMKK